MFRDQFARIESMMGAGEIDILVVDDQARLSRADNAFGFITEPYILVTQLSRSEVV